MLEKCKFIKVKVPEWGGEVLIREINGQERDEFLRILEDNISPITWLVAKSCVNPDGSLMFTESDLLLLGRRSAKALWRLYYAALNINGLSQKSVMELSYRLKQRPERRFYFRLALALGMTVKELLSRIDSQELTEWMAYYTLEPWGTEPEDFRAGIVASTIANVNRDPKKQRQPFTPKDFMPAWDKPQKQEQTPEEQRKIIEMWQAILG